MYNLYAETSAGHVNKKSIKQYPPLPSRVVYQYTVPLRSNKTPESTNQRQEITTR